MGVEVKFCGITSAADLALAQELGADYAGVVLAGGPRNRTRLQAARLFAGCRGIRRVGVLPVTEEPGGPVSEVQLDVVQLHGGADRAAIQRARESGVAEVWAVVTVRDGRLPHRADSLFQIADAIVLDTGGSTGLGGTGRAFDWQATAADLAQLGRPPRLVLAGGLNPENVIRAIRTLEPDVVDVSSGVESSPGVKDRDLMRRFVDAARSA